MLYHSKEEQLQKKIKRIENWPTPPNKKLITGFIGLCAYVRMFIENFSQVESPLRRLTREDVDWDWDQKWEEAFHKLRMIVGEEITLKILDYDKGAVKIKVEVDSRYISTGAEQTQEEKEKKERIVLYE
ncbi:hypothetical protein O181_081440 [Austropuccinia psidii MF-1]|uniref:Reverse transcriptase/retrotransposon-derived protein RNase H-like domain-containing protein n=1 Tax=Austropuccinia psidii MF-1 TaxID=1389203 RepID=A0A9Q3FJ07_9BASI|nr:hypothetical protein [Austropuccinia psidii MF-1]